LTSIKKSIPNPESDCLDVEVYFAVGRKAAPRRPYASWQLAVSSLCALAITATALCPAYDGNHGWMNRLLAPSRSTGRAQG